VFLPIKLIVTDDVDVTNLIIKATNRQTEVVVEAFESLSPFQKKLEEFYSTFGKNQDPRLYYERRSKQYDGLPIAKNQIISLATQLNCFLAMFLNEPQSTHRYYGELLEVYRNRIFMDNHSPYPYYVSGYALNILERLFNEDKLDRFFKKFKYQMLMLFRLQTERFELPYLNSKKIDDYCSGLLQILSNEWEAIDVFQNTTTVIQSILDKTNFDPREAIRLKAFTTELIAEVNKNQTTSSATVERVKGTVISFSDIKGYGFIKSESYEENIFVHYSAIQGSGYRCLDWGDVVEFTIVETDKGLQARDVQVLE
jgi:cold shock CspA family protein